MGQADEPGSITPAMGDEPPDPGPATPAPPSRIRRLFAGSRDLWRVVYRDPEHVPERLTLYTTGRLGDPSREWAASMRRSHPDTPVAKIAEELRTQSAHVARIDGAISGTSFFIALVPGYLAYLQQEMPHDAAHRRARRLRPPGAAYLGGDAGAAWGALGRRAAEAALSTVRDEPPSTLRDEGPRTVRDEGRPDQPAHRRSRRTSAPSVDLLPIFGGCVSPPVAEGDTGTFGMIGAEFGVVLGGRARV